MLCQLSSQEALRLTASFAFTADRVRGAYGPAQVRASICETASRVAFLKASKLAKREETSPALGRSLYRAAFASA